MVVVERQSIDEMATVCQKSDGYGIVVSIYSRDHGKLGDKRSPAHAHVFDTSMKEIGEFVLTLESPVNSSDIIWYWTEKPPAGYAAKIIKWSRGSNKFGLNNWAFAISTWEALHSK